MFILFGVISPYDGSYLLGVFETLELAQQGRSNFRKEYQVKNKSEAYEYYEIYGPVVLNELKELTNPVDTFIPGKTKRPK